MKRRAHALLLEHDDLLRQTLRLTKPFDLDELRAAIARGAAHAGRSSDRPCDEAEYPPGA